MIVLDLTPGEKIKILLGRKEMSITDLAKELGTSKQNLHAKFKRDNFSEGELKEIGEVLGVKIEINFISEDGTKL